MKKILKRILDIALPSFINTVLLSSCLTVDLMMVGKLGTVAVSAVGLITQPFLLMQLLMVAFSTGTTTLVARTKGENNQKLANEIFRQSLLIVLLLSLLSTISGLLFAKKILLFMGAREDTIEPATIYFKIVMFGFIPFSIANCISSALRGSGETKVMLITGICSNIVNLLLDYLLIFGKLGFPKLNVAGAGIATMLSYFSSFVIYCFVLHKKKHYIYLSINEKIIINWSIIKRILKIGLPAIGNRSSVRIGMLIMAKLVASFGTVSFATYQICYNLHNVAFWSAESIASATTSLAGQCLGANDQRNAKKYISFSAMLAAGFAIFTGVIYIVFSNQIIHLFSDSTDILLLGLSIIPIIASFQPFQAANSAITGGLSGAGQTRIPAIAVAIGITIIRPIFSYLFSIRARLDLVGVWMAIGLDEVFRFVVVLLCFKNGKWLRIKV